MAEGLDESGRLRLLADFLRNSLPYRRKLGEGLPMVESAMRDPNLPEETERFYFSVYGWGEFEVTLRKTGGQAEKAPEDV